MPKFVIIVMLSAIVISGCKKKEDPADKKPPVVFKENAVELLLHTKTLPDGKVVFQLEKNIFLSNSQKQHVIVSSDTLPSLGKESVNVEEDDEEPARYQNVDKQYDVLFKVDSLKN